jgi:hypothetical protein
VLHLRSRWIPAVVLLVLCALFGACGDDAASPAATREPVATTDPSLPPRSFQLGVSSLPTEASEEAYSEAFALAGSLGEVILIQRAPPWADFLPGGSVSPRTERLTRLERDLARRNGLRLLLAIDPTQPSDRGTLAGLPASLAGRDFADKSVRASFIAYAKYLALNYKPAYLALGVEVDLYYLRRGDAAFRNFVSVYFEAYDAVKEVSPDTLVFPTFQYENVLGVLARGAPSQPSWSLVDRFLPKLDVLAVSTFPRAAFQGIEQLPGDYFRALQSRVDKPVAFFSAGWASRNEGAHDEASQISFIYRVFAAAEELQSPFLIWFLARDPDIGPDDGLGSLASMGLYSADGRPKNVLRVWRNHLARPLR